MDRRERHALEYASEQLKGFLSSRGIQFESSYEHVPIKKMSPRQLRTHYKELKEVYQSSRASQ